MVENRSGGAIYGDTFTAGPEGDVEDVVEAAFGSDTIAGSATVIGTATTMVNGDVGYTVEPVLSLTPGAYSGITITVDGGPSWVSINEVSLVTQACP